MINVMFYDKLSDCIRYHVTFNEELQIVKAYEEFITETGDIKKVIYQPYEFSIVMDKINPIWIDRIQDAMTNGKKSLTLNTVQSIKWTDNIKEAQNRYNQLIESNIKDINTSYDLHLLKLIKCNIENNKHYTDEIKEYLNNKINKIEECKINHAIPELVC